MTALRGICVGAGYFSQFHLDAWNRLDGVDIVALCDRDEQAARRRADEYQVPHTGADLPSLIDRWQPDFVDIITPPASHLELVTLAAANGVAIVCQKPLAPTLAEAEQLVAVAARSNVPLMVHENFRFQPWYREIKRLIADGAIGDRLHHIAFRSRMGDGWGERAYLDRQPYFRTMPRLLVYENGIHFIDTFRYLAGPIERVYAALRRLNPVIEGEDAAVILFEFAGGPTGLWDANRYNESTDPDPRYTFGEMLVDGNAGSIRLYQDARVTLQPLGQPERDHPYEHHRRGFAGDCVYFCLKHFVECLAEGGPFETSGTDYLVNLRIQEAVYRSAEEGQAIGGLAAESPADEETLDG